MPLLQMRDLLSRSGLHDVGRLNDHQVHKEARLLLRSAPALRSLAEVRALLAFFSGLGDSDRMSLLALFRRAIDLLDFSVAPDKGLIYAGQYSTYLEPWMGADDRLAEEIRAAEPLPSGAADKTTIAHTTGGRWLLAWNLRYLLGSSGEEEVWTRATIRFIDALSGQATVLLPASEFNLVFQTLRPHPIYSVPGIEQVVYWLDDNSKLLKNPVEGLFGAGVARVAYGKPVLFRAPR